MVRILLLFFLGVLAIPRDYPEELLHPYLEDPPKIKCPHYPEEYLNITKVIKHGSKFQTKDKTEQVGIFDDLLSEFCVPICSTKYEIYKGSILKNRQNLYVSKDFLNKKSNWCKSLFRPLI